MAKLWGGRFTKKNDPLFERFSSSFGWDVRLLPYDLAVDRAHVAALKKCRVLTAAEAARLTRALDRLERERAAGRLKLDPHAEDVHSAVQQALTRLAGPLTGKLHTGRSRNDLVAQSSRLYCKAKSAELIAAVTAVQKAVVRKAAQVRHVLVPGMTHLQNAQVVSQAHIFLSYVEMLERVKARLAMARDLADVCVLGSGALAGTTFPLDQKLMAKRLGLSRVCTNSYDVAGDRDYIVNLLSSLAFLGKHISRISEDLLIGQLKGQGLIDVDQAYCTGSSMMPQKKNADFLELARGAGAVLAGDFVGVYTLMKGVPTSYNRDLQWDKKFLFDAVETALDVLTLYARVFATLSVNAERARQLCDDDALYATDLADYLVKKGVPFRQAHHQVGEIVSFAESRRVRISRIGLDALKRFAPKLEGDVYSLFDPAHSVRLKRTQGSTHPVRVGQEIKKWRKLLGKG